MRAAATANRLHFAVIGPDKKSADFKSSGTHRNNDNSDARYTFPVSGGAHKMTTPERIMCGVVSALSIAFIALVVVLATTTNSRATSAPTPAPTIASTTTTTTVATTSSTSVTPAPAVLETSGSPLVVVNFVCNHVLRGADQGFCWAIFGYRANTTVSVPVGADNYFVHGPVANDHPTTFVEGESFGSVHTLWPCGVAADVSWVLRTNDGSVSVATASAEHYECPPIPLSL